MISDFESLSKELNERMRLFSETEQNNKNMKNLQNHLEITQDENHQKIQELMGMIKFIKNTDVNQPKNIKALKKRWKEEYGQFPIKSKKIILEENIKLFNEFYNRKSSELNV